MKNSDLPLNFQVLNISVNMARISKWTYEDPVGQSELINKFLKQTEEYLADLLKGGVSDEFKPTLQRFQLEFERLKKQKIDSKNKIYWVEKALTWANILQHRAKLA